MNMCVLTFSPPSVKKIADVMQGNQGFAEAEKGAREIAGSPAGAAHLTRVVADVTVARTASRLPCWPRLLGLLFVLLSGTGSLSALTVLSSNQLVFVNVPFFLAGGLKIIYDLMLYLSFKSRDVDR